VINEVMGGGDWRVAGRGEDERFLCGVGRGQGGGILSPFYWV